MMMTTKLEPRRAAARAATRTEHPLIAQGHCLTHFHHANLVGRVQRGWEGFLEEPQKLKSSWEFQRDPVDPQGPDDGYIMRAAQPRPEGGHYDRKQFFHYRPDLRRLLSSRKVSYKKHEQWLEDCQSLYDACMRSVLDVGNGLGPIFREKHFVDMVGKAPPDTHVLRLLCYDEEMRPGNELGKAHADRNFMTLQVHESHPGLEINIDGAWQRYRKQPDKILAFCGQKAAVECPDHLTALHHRIVTPMDAAPTADKRYSMVFFAHTDTSLESYRGGDG